jgi:hypothetical protein
MNKLFILFVTCIITVSLSAQVLEDKEFSYNPNFEDSNDVDNMTDIISSHWDTLYLRTSRKPNFYIADTQHICLRTPQFPKFQMPIPGNVISEFGYRGRRRVHTGIDIKLNHGDSVHCAFDGIVRISRYFSGYGNIVVVRHFNEIETVYAHLSKRLVNVGDTLQCGQVLGLGGRTGRATTDHLHFETRYNEQPFNPRLIIDFNAKRLYSDTLLLCQNAFKFGKSKSKKVQRQTKYTASLHQNLKGKKIHVIQKGDTLYSLARSYETTVAELCKVNGIQENDILSLGQKIRIP